MTNTFILSKVRFGQPVTDLFSLGLRSAPMIQLPQDQPDIIIRVPLPHAEITEEDLDKTKSDFQRANARVSLRAEEVYPISPSWAEIAIVGASFVGGAAATHYADKCFDALDRFLKRRIDRINLG